MSLRFTETNKWKDDWYLSLSNDYRIVWQYLLDNCSIAGLWQKGFKHLNYFCETNITEPEFYQIFSGRCFDVPDSNLIFIPKFLKVQYPSGLSSEKPLIISVRKEIEKYNLNSIIKQSLPNYYNTIKQSLPNDVRKKETGKGKWKKEKGKEDKDKVKEKDKEREVIFPFNTETFKTAWDGWKQYKKEQHRFTFKGEHSEQIALKSLAELSGNSEPKAFEIIQQSISNGWKGFFELKNIQNGKQQFGGKLDLGAIEQSANEFLEKSGLGRKGN